MNIVDTDYSSLKFIVYARKSTESEDRQAASIPDQLDEVHKIVKQNNYKVVKEFTESGSAHLRNNRPVFDKIVQMFERGEANGLIVWQLNRIARNPFEHGWIQQLLLEGKIQLIHTPGHLYRPGDNLIEYSVEASMAAQYSIDLSKNVTRGMHSKNKRGGITSLAPQGYINARTKDRQAIIEPDPERFDIVKKMFKAYLSGAYSGPELLDIINNDWHYTTPKHKKRGGGKLSINGLYNILENPVYMGKVRDHENPNHLIQGYWEPMITEEEYWRVQKIRGKYGIAHNFRPKTASNSRRYELKGLMTCSSCGCSIIAEPHQRKLKNGDYNEHMYYRCTHKSPTRKCTLRGGITEEEAFRQIDEMLEKTKIHPLLYDWGMEILRDIKARETTERYQVAKTQNASLDDCEKQLHELVKMRTRGLINDEIFKQESEELENLIDAIKRSNRDTEEKNKNWYEVIGKTLDVMRNPRDKFDVATTSGERRAILQALGPTATLTEKETKDADGKVLTRKIIEVELYPWVELLEKSAQKMEPELNKVLTAPQQRKNDLKRSSFILWSG